MWRAEPRALSERSCVVMEEAVVYQRLREEGFREGMSQVPRQAETCWTQHRGGQAWLKREFQRDGERRCSRRGKGKQCGQQGRGPWVIAEAPARESSEFAQDPGSHPCPRIPVGLCPLLSQRLEVVLSGGCE